MNRKIESTRLWGYDVLDEETHEKDMAIKVLDEPILVGLIVLKNDKQKMKRDDQNLLFTLTYLGIEVQFPPQLLA